MSGPPPAAFCRGPLAYRHQLAVGVLSEWEFAVQPPYERACGWFAEREYTPERLRDNLEARVSGSPEERVAVACSAIPGAWQDAHRPVVVPRPPAPRRGGAMRAVIDDSGPTIPPEERRPSAEGGLLPMLGRGTLRRVAVGPVEVPLAAIALGTLLAWWAFWAWWALGRARASPRP